MVAIDGGSTLSERLDAVLAEIRAEFGRQEVKWGTDRDLGGQLWNTVLVEEVGEVSRAILHYDHDNLRVEIVQVAAVCLAWLENLERYRERGSLDAYLIRSGMELTGRDAG